MWYPILSELSVETDGAGWPVESVNNMVSEKHTGYPTGFTYFELS